MRRRGSGGELLWTLMVPGAHLPVDARVEAVGIGCERLVEVEVVPARDDLAVGIAAHLFEELLQEADGFLQVERVLGTADDMDLTLQLRTQRRPVPFENAADVVLLPGALDLGGLSAGLAVAEQLRAAA